MARHPLVKKKFRLFVLAHGPKIGRAAGTLQPTRRRHRRRGAERQAPRPRRDRTQCPLRTRDVSASAPHCCSAAPSRIWTDNPRRRAWPARPVQHHETAAGGGWRIPALTKAPARMVLAPRAASTTRVPFVVERAILEPGGISEPMISVGELPKSKPATFALPRSPMRKSVLADAASSTEATGTTLAPFETRTAMVVLALKASTTTTTEPARAARRAPPA
jgi:hypothetical protein